MSDRGPGGGQSGGRRSSARLAAVQALYEMEITDVPVDGLLADFLARRWKLTEVHGANELGEGPGEGGTPPVALVAPDLAFLEALVRGVAERKAEMDLTIAGALAPDGTPLERMEALLRAILRLGAFELAARPDVPAATIINEYIEVAHAFFTEHESSLVNGVLDRLARTMRGGNNTHDTEKTAGAG